MKPNSLRCLLIFDEPASGAWNMALDEALLQQAPQFDGCVLRFYQWNEPTLSLGYFQNYSQRHSHVKSNDCPIVRRSSGGGAIVHDCELTYSLIVPKRFRLAKNPRQLYHSLHTSLQQSLASFAVKQTRLVSAEESNKEKSQPFLCFQRRSEFDLLLASQLPDNSQIPNDSQYYSEAKICGSAQRRTKESIMQHGSILLAASAAAPQLPGIFELSGVKIDPQELQTTFCDQIVESLEFTYDKQSLLPETIKLAEKICTAKYANHGWTHKR